VTRICENPATAWAIQIKKKGGPFKERFRKLWLKGIYKRGGYKSQEHKVNAIRVHKENVRLGIKPIRLTAKQRNMRFAMGGSSARKRKVTLPVLKLPD
jgi:hypothetical protein